MAILSLPPSLRLPVAVTPRTGCAGSTVCPEVLVGPKYACKCCQSQLAVSAHLPEPSEKGLPATSWSIRAMAITLFVVCDDTPTEAVPVLRGRPRHVKTLLIGRLRSS